MKGEQLLAQTHFLVLYELYEDITSMMLGDTLPINAVDICFYYIVNARI